MTAIYQYLGCQGKDEGIAFLKWMHTSVGCVLTMKGGRQLEERRPEGRDGRTCRSIVSVSPYLGKFDILLRN